MSKIESTSRRYEDKNQKLTYEDTLKKAKKSA